MNPARLAPHLRRIVLLITALAALYLFLRFDVYVLPREGCSPLSRFDAGDRLLLDRRPPGYGVGDAVLARGEDGLLYLGIVTRVRPEGAEPEAVTALWIETDVPDCPGRDSDELGWIETGEVAARIVMEWPW